MIQGEAREELCGAEVMVVEEFVETDRWCKGDGKAWSRTGSLLSVFL